LRLQEVNGSTGPNLIAGCLAQSDRLLVVIGEDAQQVFTGLGLHNAGQVLRAHFRTRFDNTAQDFFFSTAAQVKQFGTKHWLERFGLMTRSATALKNLSAGGRIAVLSKSASIPFKHSGPVLDSWTEKAERAFR
jgi:hypothetical protein